MPADSHCRPELNAGSRFRSREPAPTAAQPRRPTLGRRATACNNEAARLAADSKNACDQSGWRDSNPRPPAPKAGALTKLRYIPLP